MAGSSTTVPRERSPRADSAGHWLRHARSDFRAGTVLRADDTVLREIACFHFQQAAEKALKVVFVARSQDFPRVHDIRQLLDLLSSSGLTLPSTVLDSEVLTPYAVQLRYPVDLPAISDDEIDEAQTAAEATLVWAEQQLTTAARSEHAQRQDRT